MKKTLLIMVMALALLLTQCKKPSIKFPSPVAPEGTTVSMTVTAGPGSKTDISETGAITWSTGDKLYVGDGTKYVGYLTIVSGSGTPTGTFSGDVTLTGIPEGTPQTFHFFYLGSVDYTGSLKKGESTTVDVDFSSQNIYADVNNKLVSASKHHVGYGTANGAVSGGVVTGINVTLVSKVALARFSFTKGSTDYTDELTLSGTNIYKEMTVNFAGTFTGKDKGTISLTGGHGERYVMLVPTGDATEQTLTFDGGSESGTGAVPGLESNKFYGKTGAIPVTLTAPYLPDDFTVSSGVTVKFSKGNLYYDGTTDNKWKFEANQYDFRTYNGKGSCINGTYNEDGGTPANDWGLFGWSSSSQTHYGMNISTSSSDYSGETFKDWGTAPGLPSAGDGKTWRTLSKAEWVYLLNTGGSSGRTDANRFAKAKVNGVRGLLIFPDGYNDGTPIGSITGVAALNTTSAAYPDDDIPTKTWTSMETAGVVFLPAAGYRSGTAVGSVGSHGNYWSKTFNGAKTVDYMVFDSGNVGTDRYQRSRGNSVRLVRDSESGNGSANAFTGGTW